MKTFFGAAYCFTIASALRVETSYFYTYVSADCEDLLWTMFDHYLHLQSTNNGAILKDLNDLYIDIVTAE